MIPISLDAVLMTENDEFLERGTLIIPPTGTTVDFKNDFVPLVSLGHTVKISIEVSGQTCVDISGEVYLSSKNLLRLVSVDSKKLEIIRSFFVSNTNFPISLEVAGSALTRLLRKQGDLIDGNVYYITSKTLNFHSIKQVNVGQSLLINIEHPLSLKNVMVKVMDKDKFGTRATRYNCSIIKISSACQKNLDSFVESLEKDSSMSAKITK